MIKIKRGVAVILSLFSGSRKPINAKDTATPYRRITSCCAYFVNFRDLRKATYIGNTKISQSYMRSKRLARSGIACVVNK